MLGHPSSFLGVRISCCSQLRSVGVPAVNTSQYESGCGRGSVAAFGPRFGVHHVSHIVTVIFMIEVTQGGGGGVGV